MLFSVGAIVIDSICQQSITFMSFTALLIFFIHWNRIEMLHCLLVNDGEINYMESVFAISACVTMNRILLFLVYQATNRIFAVSTCISHIEKIAIE